VTTAVADDRAVSEPNQWAFVSYAYAALVVFGMGYFLLDLPIQVSDSYGNLVQATDGTLASLVYEQFRTRAFLRPFLWAHIRIVYDVSGGHYYEWFRGWHVGQFAVLTILFLRLVRPRTLSAAAAVPLGLAALIGIHTFAGTVREAFPINTFMTILVCCYLAADLALGPPRWWRDVAAALLFVFAALTVESGLLVAVVVVAAYLGGARGVSRGGMATIVLLVAAYLFLRFVVLHVGAPGLEERSSGFGFSTLEPDQLASMFGGTAFPFYLYNVVSSCLSVLFSEPRAGIWGVTRDIVHDESSVAGLVSLVASGLGTLVIAFYIWRRRSDWRARRFNRNDQLVIVFIAVTLANSAISYAYTKDVILSPAGAFFAVALAVGATYVLESVTGASGRQQAAAVMLLLVLSGAWAFRAVGIHVGLRTSAAALRNDWAYVDDWLAREHRVPTDPRAIALKNHLQHDAIRRHPARPAVTGGWVEWFGEN
jgi:hypothetical protein